MNDIPSEWIYDETQQDYYCHFYDEYGKLIQTIWRNDQSREDSCEPRYDAASTLVFTDLGIQHQPLEITQADYEHAQYSGSPQENQHPEYLTKQELVDERIIKSGDPRPYFTVPHRDHKKQFKPGRIFKSFSHSQKSDRVTENGTYYTVKQAQRRESYIKVQFYIVIWNHGNHSQCVPINTYSERGVSGKAQKAIHHVIAYTGREAPDCLPEEKGLTFAGEPIKIKLDAEAKAAGETLSPISRICLVKISDVQHNIPILPVGRVRSAELKRLHQLILGLMGQASALLKMSDGDDSDE